MFYGSALRYLFLGGYLLGTAELCLMLEICMSDGGSGLMICHILGIKIVFMCILNYLQGLIL